MSDKNLDLIMDVNVDIYVRIGNGMIPMKEVVALEPGSIVQLDQKSDDPVGLYVNNKLVAHGEVVKVEDKLGIRVQSIVGQEA